MNASNHAEQLMHMAEKDIKALQFMISSDAIADEIFGFHAQQAVEKTLKAWIDASGGSFGWVHDLRILLLTLQDLGFGMESYQELISLNTYAVRFRYEPLDDEDEPLDRAGILCQVESLFDRVRNILGRQTNL